MNRLWYRLKNLRHRLRGLPQEIRYHAGIGVTAELRAKILMANGGELDLGVVSRRVVTDAFVAAIVDAFQNTFELENFNYHDSGTGSNAEAVGNTTLQTPAGPARIVGTQSEPAANQYRTQATITYSTSQTITEHGLFSASSGGVLADRSVFTGIPVVNLDAIQYTYTLTFPSGG